MGDTPGSSTLNEEQQQWMLERFGLRYHAVQDNASMPNRKQRRAWAKKRKR